ncbi:MAG: RdgB/HAM1 family non-canonical purine NTP pyrophosphatase [candidate division WOR-3 bacterium]|nr:MAG: RdgB/HAM1 family non-canonical purine NTP pyrophosphatase [candidate division WOR-3 bacterium]
MRKKDKSQHIILATRNENKVIEIKEIIGDLVSIGTPDRSLQIDIPECGRSLVENSCAKAIFAYRLHGIPTLADDSGLFVDALEGEPGIYSARYGRNDEERIARLLHELGDAHDRRAAFRVAFVYCYEHGKYEVFEGVCKGEIAHEPKGVSGFGYDPIFIPRGYKKTFAQLGPATKNRISHRARALQKFRKYLMEVAR